MQHNKDLEFSSSKSHNSITKPKQFVCLFLETTTQLNAKCLSAHPTLSYRFQSSETSRLRLGPTQPSSQWVPGSFPRVKRPGHDVYHSPQDTAGVKKDWSHISTPPIHFHGVYRDIFTFLFLLGIYLIIRIIIRVTG
jgi:hypothetical protein